MIQQIHVKAFLITMRLLDMEKIFLLSAATKMFTVN